MKEKIAEKDELEIELAAERTKNKKLTKELKDIADKAKRAGESDVEVARLRSDLTEARDENKTLRDENDTLRSDLERAKKRQRTSETGDSREKPAGGTPFDIEHFESMRVKSISFSATY